MNLNERHGWHGRIRVTGRDKAGRVLFVDEFDNLLTNVGLDVLSSALGSAVAGHAQIKYLAWGTGTTAPNVADTVLDTEVGRQTITDATDGATGEWVTTTYLAPATAVVHIKELGWFAGPSATGTVDTGVLLARVLYDRDKSNVESLQIERTDTLAAV